MFRPYLMVSVEQPDDGPIAGPKHAVVIYNIVLFMKFYTLYFDSTQRG